MHLSPRIFYGFSKFWYLDEATMTYYPFLAKIRCWRHGIRLEFFGINFYLPAANSAVYRTRSRIPPMCRGAPPVMCDDHTTLGEVGESFSMTRYESAVICFLSRLRFFSSSRCSNQLTYSYQVTDSSELLEADANPLLGFQSLTYSQACY